MTLPEGSVRANAALVQHLHDSTGLSWRQLGRLFGVGLRAVHAWAAGSPINRHHQDMVTALARTVDQFGDDPETVHAALFADRHGGSNLYTEFIRARIRDQGPDIHFTINPWHDNQP